MLITDFCPSPLHWGKHFTSWALSREWLLWNVLKMHHFTQLGFTDNLELKEEDSKRNRLNTLLVCRTETINRETIVWVMWVFSFNTFGEQTLGKQYREDRYNAGKSQSKKVSCSMSCNCYLTSKRFLKRNHSCVVLGECFSLCLFPFVVSHVVVLILPMSFCVQHVLDNRRIYVETNQY